VEKAEGNGLYSPRMSLVVVAEELLFESKPDYDVILA